MEKNEIIDIIISLVKGVNNENHIEAGNQKLWGCEYLLNQTIRQYEIPTDHYFVSEEAKKLWDHITSDNITDFYYQKKLTLDRVDGSVKLRCYTGNSKKYTEWTPNKGDKLTYRDVFHDEHIVPVKVIIDELVKLPELNYETVTKVLDNIRVCKMLKSEDKKITNKYKRPLDYKKAIAENYTPNGIVCLDIITGKKII